MPWLTPTEIDSQRGQRDPARTESAPPYRAERGAALPWWKR
jgi:hypothetical protein